MPYYEKKFEIRFYKCWSFGVIYEFEQLTIGLIKWKLVIGLFKHYDKIPF